MGSSSCWLHAQEQNLFKNSNTVVKTAFRKDINVLVLLSEVTNVSVNVVIDINHYLVNFSSNNKRRSKRNSETRRFLFVFFACLFVVVFVASLGVASSI